jgi:hypothetical protein
MSSENAVCDHCKRTTSGVISLADLGTPPRRVIDAAHQLGARVLSPQDIEAPPDVHQCLPQSEWRSKWNPRRDRKRDLAQQL